MTNEIVFSIRDLSCSYDRIKANRVLYIPSLDIHRGELVFLLGSSGSGKSTLLEALGLMNNTIADGTIAFHKDATTSIDIAGLWQPGTEQKAAEIRKSNFSFIFQNTNLMDNFTAYENICLSKMIQTGSPQNAAMKGAKELMDKVGLPESQVSTSALSVNLSGGQRQRVAFVRALNSDCTVLFGDEPTGNLDEANANELMHIVSSYLRRNVTAIVVSHDINLALNHATRIICLTRNPENGIGEILPENTFARKDWQDLPADQLVQFHNTIKSFYQRTEGKKLIAKVSQPEAKLSKNYVSLFLNKEGKALAGKGGTNLIILSLLLLFTFLAIGFANGSLEYLGKKLDDPFVNWLTVEIPYSKSDDAGTIMHSLDEDNVKKQFNIKSTNSFSEMPLFFWNKKARRFLPAKSRSIDLTRDQPDPILSVIVSNDHNNLIHGAEFLDYKDLSIIVTERFLDELGYNRDSPFVYIESPVDDNIDTMPIGIRAVVKELPGKAQVAYTTYFRNAFLQKPDCTFDRRGKKILQLYLPVKKSEAVELRKKIETFLTNNAQYNSYRPEVNYPNRSYVTFLPTAYAISISFAEGPSYRLFDSLYTDLIKDTELEKELHKGIRFYDYENFNPVNAEKSMDMLSINFSKLDSVRSFSTFLFNTFNDAEEIKTGGTIEVDINKVTEKENFLFLSNITTIISFILILFGTVAVSLFVFNLLKMHLLKVKMNIGTFKAFGLSNAEAQGIYFMIVLKFVLLSLIISLMVAFSLGKVLNNVLLPMWVNVEKGVDYFNLIDKFTILTLVLILVSALTVSWFTIRNILFKSPGDLIYNR